MAGIAATRRISALLRADALSVRRDPILAFGTLIAILPAILLPIYRADINAAAQAAFGLDDLALYITAPSLALPAFMVGWITGFLLIEDRDDHVLEVLDVTPLGKPGFFAYRLGVATLLAALVSMVCTAILTPWLSPAHWLAIAFVAATLAPTVGLILLAFARNKVEGLALTKLVNLLLLATLLPALPGAWRFAGALFPPYWIGEIAGLPPAHLPLAFSSLMGLAVGVAVLGGAFALAIRRIG